MEKDQAKTIINSRKLIATDGKYELRVTNVTPYHRDLGNGRSQTAIVNVAGMTLYHATQAAALYTQGEYQEAVNNNISFSVRDNDYMPKKGEVLECFVETIVTKSGVTGQFVSSFSAAPIQPAKAMSLDSFLNGGHASTERAEMIIQDSEEMPAFDAPVSKKK